MPRVPTSTQKLRPKDQDLSIIQDNLAIPLDKVLAFINGLVNGTTAEALIIGALTAASAAVTGAITGASVTVTGLIKGATATITGALAAASVAATGAITGASITVTGLVQGATAAFTGAVTAGTLAATTTITGATVTGSTTVVSGAGFKAVIGPFNYFNSAYPGGVVVTSTAIKDNAGATFAQVQTYCTMPFAGSVVGVGAAYYGATSTTTQVIVLKNNSALVPSATIVGAGTAFTYGQASYSKGAYPFAAGDRLSVSVGFGATGSCGAEVFLFVELAA